VNKNYRDDIKLIDRHCETAENVTSSMNGCAQFYCIRRLITTQIAYGGNIGDYCNVWDKQQCHI